jgi:hypothetical protein
MSFINPSVITENLLTENYAWVDNLLREKYYKYALTIENYDEFYSAGILPKNYDFDFEEIENPVCKRSEDEIFDYKDNSNRLGCQSPIPSNEYKYVRQNKNKVEDDCSLLVSELTDEEDEDGVKIFPVEDYDYEEDYAQCYEEYYEDDHLGDPIRKYSYDSP